jgi:predicted transcriptional regulator
MDGSEDNRTTRDADSATESAVLRLLLQLHPIQVTVDELVRELSGEQPGFAERDSIERAVRDLVATGLLHRHDELLLPTRAALRLSELLDR